MEIQNTAGRKSFGSLTLKEFFAEFLGASDVESDDEGMEICFSHIHIDPDDGQKDCVLSVANLKPNHRLANITELARAMRETFPENGYPK